MASIANEGANEMTRPVLWIVLNERIGEKSLETNKRTHQHTRRIDNTYRRRWNDGKDGRERQLRRVLQQQQVIHN